MDTYLTLNLAVLAVVLLFVRRSLDTRRAWLVTLVSLLVLTAVFDNALIALGMYAYAPDKILGLHIWLAPVEDFMYALLAAILIPAVWNKLGDRHVR